MEDSLLINDLDQLKALADPLRQKILGAFCCAPATTKQVADQLGEKSTRLYHHVDILEKAGLIQLVETRQNRGTLEKYYLAAARQFIVDRQLLSAGQETDQDAIGPGTMLTNMLQSALHESSTRFDAQAVGKSDQPKTLLLAQGHIEMTESEAQMFIQKLQELLNDCESEGESEGRRSYSLNVAFFPVIKENHPTILHDD
jgi:DNA-binding MarR family transcriptional regulator